jgi:NAD-dependent deacetylase
MTDGNAAGPGAAGPGGRDARPDDPDDRSGLIDRLAELMERHRPAVVLTGAGISTESGIPDFRSPGTGLWNYIDPMEDLSAETLRARPAHFWRCFRALRGSGLKAEPNRGHLALARLEKSGHVRLVITQNIDGLHHKAGSRRVLEIHGHLRTARCQSCGQRQPLIEALEQLSSREIPECGCGGHLRPDVVLFGDPMPPAFEEAWRKAAGSRLLLVVGSSLTVWPAASLAELTPHLAVINRDPTPADVHADVVIRGSAGEILSALAERLGA